MKKNYCVYLLLVMYGCSVFATESTLQHEQSNQNEKVIESSIDGKISENKDDKSTAVNDKVDENNVTEETPKKPGMLDSWKKVITLKWKTLSRDDAWNLGKTVTFAGGGYVIYSYFNAFQGLLPDNHNMNNNNNPFNGNQRQPNLQGSQGQEGRTRRNETLRQMQEQMRQQQELLQQLQQQEENEVAEAMRQSLAEQRNRNLPVTNPAGNNRNLPVTNPTNGNSAVVEENQNPNVLGQPRDCDLCTETKNADQFTTMPCCQYSPCTECLMGHLASHFDDNSTANLKCPNMLCDTKIKQPIMKIITSSNADLYLNYHQVRLRECLAKMGLKQCPTTDCQSQFEADQRGKERVTCQGCNQRYCSYCLIDHDMRATTCDQARRDEEIRRNPNLNNQISEQFIRDNTKNCPNRRCNRPILKNGGCNHMTCGQCRHEFCWTCLATYRTTLCNAGGCVVQNINTGYNF